GSGLGQTREERVRQSQDREPSVLDYSAYVPIGDAPMKLRTWRALGGDILYLSSHRRPERVAADQAVLSRYGFPAGPLLFRAGDETYADVAARTAPDVLIEDDCESIGGAAQMVFACAPTEPETAVTAIVVREFGGIDALPDDLAALSAYASPLPQASSNRLSGESR